MRFSVRMYFIRDGETISIWSFNSIGKFVQFLDRIAWFHMFYRFKSTRRMKRAREGDCEIMYQPHTMIEPDFLLSLGIFAFYFEIYANIFEMI